MWLVRVFITVVLITLIGVGVMFFAQPKLRAVGEGYYYYNQGNLAYQEYRFSDAKWYYEYALPLHPEPAKVYLRLGDTETMLGNPVHALDAYQHALEADPGMKEAVIKVADKEWQEGHRKIALALYKNAVRHNPDDVELHLRLADLYLAIAQQTGNPEAYDKASAIYQRYWDHHEHAKYRVAQIYYDRGRYSKALRIYCELAEKHPRNPETLYSLALTLEKEGALQQAYSMMWKAAEIMEAKKDDLAIEWAREAMNYKDRLALYTEAPDLTIQTCMHNIAEAEAERVKQDKAE